MRKIRVPFVRNRRIQDGLSGFLKQVGCFMKRFKVQDLQNSSIALSLTPALKSPPPPEIKIIIVKRMNIQSLSDDFQTWGYLVFVGNVRTITIHFFSCKITSTKKLWIGAFSLESKSCYHVFTKQSKMPPSFLYRK